MRQMRCDQCGRALAPAAATTVVCPSCGYAAIVPSQALSGSAVPDDDSATRPVRSEPAPVPAAVLPSQEMPTSPPPPPLDAQTATAAPLGVYTPPSLPRSRNDAPAEPIPAGSDQRDDEAPSTPTALLRGRDPLNDTRPVEGPVAQAGAASGGKRSRWTFISAVALVIVLALGTSGALLEANGRLNALLAPFLPAAAPTAIPTVTAGPPPPPAGFTRFTAPDGTYSVDVPANWHTGNGTANQLVLFTDTTGTVDFEIESLPGLLDPKEVTNDFFAAFGPQSPGAVHAGPATQDSVPVAGMEWTRTAADVGVVSSGATVSWHLVVLTAQHNGNTLVIGYFAPRNIFPTEDSSHFQVMLGSLMLLSPQP
jgi:hypothetical protein